MTVRPCRQLSEGQRTKSKNSSNDQNEMERQSHERTREKMIARREPRGITKLVHGSPKEKVRPRRVLYHRS